MIIAIDYDETYDMDPTFWEEVKHLAECREHKVICVTARYTKPGTHDRHERVPSFPIYCTSNQPKRAYMASLGIKVDVWVDDSPESIVSYAESGGLLLP